MLDNQNKAKSILPSGKVDKLSMTTQQGSVKAETLN